MSPLSNKLPFSEKENFQTPSLFQAPSPNSYMIDVLIYHDCYTSCGLINRYVSPTSSKF